MAEKTKTTLKKNQTAEIPTKNGNKYSYQYVDIAQIHEYLESINASYYQFIDRIGEDDYIMTVPIINGVEQPARRGSRIVQASLMGNNNPAQEQGSALTYARRYSLLMAFGLATEDDDAQSLNQKKEVTEKEAKEYVFAFGKNKGKKLIDLVNDEDGYIDWLLDNSKDEYLLKCIELLTGQVPLTDEEKKESVNLTAKFEELLIKTNTDRESLYAHYKVEKYDELTTEQIKEAITIMERKTK